MKSILNKLFDRFGHQLIPKDSDTYRSLSDIYSDSEFKEVYDACKNYTMTSVERMYALYMATKYVAKNGVDGDFVECGVWRGGSAMIIAMTLIRMGIDDRTIYLYDTYCGMPEPEEIDYDFTNKHAGERWESSQKIDHNEWCYAPLDEVKRNMYSTEYPENNIEFVVGNVEDTIPGLVPSNISLLRLDTDWYKSIYHCLNHLFPLLSQNGTIIIDDYGHWQGAKEATDRYFKEKGLNILLNRIDYTGRIGIKI